MARDHQSGRNPNIVTSSVFPDTYPITVSYFTVTDSVPSGAYAGCEVVRHQAGNANIAWSGESYTGTYNLFVTGRTNAMTANLGVVNHRGLVFNGASSKNYVNATLGTGNPGALAIGATGKIEIGNRDDYGSPMSGRMMEIAIWDVELNLNEIWSLYRRVSPLVVRPRSLKAYWPYWGITYPEYDFGPLKMHLSSAGGNPALFSRHMAGSPMAL